MVEKKVLRLVLGDQLNSGHSWYEQADGDVTYVLMEVRSETDYALHHIQKVAGFFAAMRSFASELVAQEHNVLYLNIDDADNRQSITENILHLVAVHGFTAFEYQLPDEYRVDVELRDMQGKLSIPVVVCDTEHFYG
jgi:deoxyribodipyrimidine photolyase-related protein